MNDEITQEEIATLEQENRQLRARNERMESELSEANRSQEPFGYFKPEPFGWTDCSESSDGAIALYDRPVMIGVCQQCGHEHEIKQEEKTK